MGKLWHSWQLGFTVALFVGLSAIIAVLWAFLLLLPLFLVCDLIGQPEPGFFWVYLLAALLFPLAVGKMIQGTDLNWLEADITGAKQARNGGSEATPSA